MTQQNLKCDFCTEEDESKCHPRWKQWVDKNAKPKVPQVCQCQPKPTRFQKPGPMREEDWLRFNNWVNEALSRKSCSNDDGNCRTDKCTHHKKIEKRWNNLAVPKYRREKYSSKTPGCTCSGNANNDIKIPRWWIHEESEMEFWRNMRFPICSKALEYKISDRIENLAKPKKLPVRPHCPIPEPPCEEPIKRVKMTRKQWRQHKKRLHYLSDSTYMTTRTEKVLNKIK